METKLPYYEECLLGRRQNALNSRSNNNGLKGPLKVVRLCLLGILLPCFLVALILYMRYKVYVDQLYPLSVSDMRVLDNRISTTWCQRQLVKTNATFNAFLLPQSPKMSVGHKTMRMVRHLDLEDDTKEYWGFYLLKGSIVTISTCVRWPGASLIVIRGHKHLHECAYIGDNSSEELDELMESLAEKSAQEIADSKPKNQSAPPNAPDLMKRHRSDVKFHHPQTNASTAKVLTHQLSEEDHNNEMTDPKAMRKILNTLNDLKSAKKTHVHRNSTVGKGEMSNFDFQNVTSVSHMSTLTLSESEELVSDVLKKLQALGGKGDRVLEKLALKYTKIREDLMKNKAKGKNFPKAHIQFEENVDRNRKRRELQNALSSNEEDDNLAMEEDFVPDGIADHHSIIDETTLNDKSNSEFWSSFSSSEEALLNCAGLILNLPLTPHTQCLRELSDNEIERASLANKITYKVPTNGYYFFVFNSENEIQTNYIRVQFHIEKTLYNVTESVSQCTNSTHQCEMNLRFFSSEKLVMELPAKSDQDMFNEEFVVVSICEPRTSIYIVCVLAVPILVILFAFQ